MSYTQVVGYSFTNKVNYAIKYAKNWKIWENKNYTYNNLHSVLYKQYCDTLNNNANYATTSVRNSKIISEQCAKFSKYVWAYIFVSVAGTEKANGGVTIIQDTKNYNDFVKKKLKQAVKECQYYEGTYLVLPDVEMKLLYSMIDDPLYALQVRSDNDTYNYTSTTDPTNTGNNNGGSETSININTLIVIAIIIVLIVKK